LLPFAFYTFYAIFKHRILDVKVVSTEIVSFFLVVAAFSQILLSESIGETVFQSAVFITLFIFSVLLIRSVIREVRQREQLEILSKELAAANKELKKLDQLKSDFLSFVSHQLRAPLTVIKGYISMIEEGTYGKIPENINPVLGKVYVSNEKLIRLVNDFLNLSRIEQGRVQFEFEKTSVASLVGEAVDALKDNAAKRGLQLLWQKPEGIPDIVIDKSKVYEIIYNLIDNAIKYTQKGSVSVLLSKKPKSIIIAVKDTGIGMSREDIGQLFQRFGRVEAGKKVNTSGTGIGLYVAKYMVEAHKGKIWAESAGRGEGSAFFVEFPLG
ncbi:MAG: HAMP domain-containing histidine kinase, partial [Candidatus Niyogibacteria bacterium]|nr:HAMP domain-containing histidine kinase [Candidatus Niyogibacteria bacterium]